MVSYSHIICAKGYYVAMVSASVETDEDPKVEIKAGLDLLGAIEEIFIRVDTLYEPLESGKESNLWISKSYDASSHFEIASNDILEMYEKITGEKLDLNIEAPDEDEY